jgi:hypothetical protein
MEQIAGRGVNLMMTRGIMTRRLFHIAASHLAKDRAGGRHGQQDKQRCCKNPEPIAEG